LYERTKLPRTLQETGKVQKSQLAEIAKKALDDGSIIYNPKEAVWMICSQSSKKHGAKHHDARYQMMPSPCNIQ
jgi:hypothetical protein